MGSYVQKLGIGLQDAADSDVKQGVAPMLNRLDEENPGGELKGAELNTNDWTESEIQRLEEYLPGVKGAERKCLKRDIARLKKQQLWELSRW